MKNTLTTFAALSVLLVAAPALADNPSSSDKMTYEATPNGGSKAVEKSVSTDANGTTTTEETSKKVDIDSKGNTTTKVDVKDTVDPPGLGNKQTTEIKNEATDKNGAVSSSHKKIVNGKTVEDVKDVQKSTPAQ